MILKCFTFRLLHRLMLRFIGLVMNGRCAGLYFLENRGSVIKVCPSVSECKRRDQNYYYTYKLAGFGMLIISCFSILVTVNTQQWSVLMRQSEKDSGASQCWT